MDFLFLKRYFSFALFGQGDVKVAQKVFLALTFIDSFQVPRSTYLFLQLFI